MNLDRERYIEAARTRAEALYAGVLVPHRSCGIALAETFGLPTGSYQALRRGGLTGEGTCGAVVAGTLVLGELLGDPDPGGPPTAVLKDAARRYRAAIAARVDGRPDDSCNVRVAGFPDFAGAARQKSCTHLAATVAAAVAEVLWDVGQPQPIPRAPWASDEPPIPD